MLYGVIRVLVFPIGLARQLQIEQIDQRCKTYSVIQIGYFQHFAGHFQRRCHDDGCQSVASYLGIVWRDLVLWASGDVMALPDYTHTSKLRNNTGRMANDLHISVPTKPTRNPTAPPFTVATKNFRSIDFFGGTVAAGGSAKVTWFSKQRRDRILSGNGTFNGANIGAVRTAALVPDFQRLEDGQWVVLVDNQNEFSVE